MNVCVCLLAFTAIVHEKTQNMQASLLNLQNSPRIKSLGNLEMVLIKVIVIALFAMHEEGHERRVVVVGSALHGHSILDVCVCAARGLLHGVDK